MSSGTDYVDFHLNMCGGLIHIPDIVGPAYHLIFIADSARNICGTLFNVLKNYLAHIRSLLIVQLFEDTEAAFLTK